MGWRTRWGGEGLGRRMGSMGRMGCMGAEGWMRDGAERKHAPNQLPETIPGAPAGIRITDAPPPQIRYDYRLL